MSERQRNGPKAEGSSAKESFLVSAPAISMPKGGGAIHGLGEKFAANPVMGTASMSIPIAISPGRSGFGPQLSLSYDSAAGNGIFGLGWNLSLPSITRKTDKGLPRYFDAEESDVYILSGAEDLVPVLADDGTHYEDATAAPGYRIRRYRPRIEGLFARIDRWTSKTDPKDVFWRSISRDNITTWYGKTDESRISDPQDASHIFSWLIGESHDDKGNTIVYKYAEENSDNITASLASERNRTTTSRKANRHLKRIYYGNRTSRLIEPDLTRVDWHFQVVFDYGENHYRNVSADGSDPFFVEASDEPPQPVSWPLRKDPFSSYRSGFEVRAYRLCRRVLMFHAFDELGSTPCLVSSTDFQYEEGPVASFISAVSHSGYVRQRDTANAFIDRYRKKSLPPVEFTYSKIPTRNELAQLPVQDIDAANLENMPVGLDGQRYQWVDFDGEGISGVLSEQSGAWYYKDNLGNGSFGAAKPVTEIPSLATTSGHHQLLDLAGDGQLDVVMLDSPISGFFERTTDASWELFRSFTSVPQVAWRDPNLKFVDLTGDGHADLIVSEDEAFVWYASLAEDGFAPAERVAKALDEEQGPHLVFADATQSIYLADMSGDGLPDIVRIRNGSVCYWPNLGYARFGAKVTMDNAPWFDAADIFDQRRIRLADTDGNGVTDIIYLRHDGPRIHFNEVGNRWSDAITIPQCPRVDDLSSVQILDLLGIGTACLVWSSALPGDAQRPMRYVDLMGGRKPHLLIKTVNNLGAETHVAYASSTKFYLEDKRLGKPWITRLPFPVHVVERVETFDWISKNRFVTRYAYHHGYFDGVEREFRGFGMIEQWDTEAFTALSSNGVFPSAANIEAASHVPPVHTKTWFHTGVYLGREHVSNFFAGLLHEIDVGEYYPQDRKGDAAADAAAKALLLDDTILPSGLTIDEEREACRALKGSMLRQEIYALDGSDKAKHPYTVTEQNFAVERLQARAGNRYAVFLAHPREALSYHCERNPADPRVSHALTLEVDRYGNVLKSLAIGYGRSPGLSPLDGDDKDKQERTHITYTENEVTEAIDDDLEYPNDYRTPVPCEIRTYEVTGFNLAAGAVRFSFKDFADNDFQALLSLTEIQYEEPTDYTKKQKRLIECVRTRFRKDDLSALLQKQKLEPRALPGESYKLAFTPGLLDQVYFRGTEKLLPNDPADILEGGGGDRGGYVDLDGDGRWWISSGRIFYSPNSADSAAAELAHARQHFFLPHRYRDPFHAATWNTDSFVRYDGYDLLVEETRDAVGNNLSAVHDYRVLQPRMVTDPNGNRVEAGFDILGMVVGTAVMGKAPPDAAEGDTLESFEPDLTQVQIDGFYDVADPHVPAPNLLKGATTRIIYDAERFRRTHQAHPEDPKQWLPAYAATLARETHVNDPLPPQGLKIQISFSYSDGFGREIQKKIQAEPGPLIRRGPDVSPRWVGSGWTIFNNKGKPVRQYEPFFSRLAEKRHQYEFGIQVGVSPVLFYDPLERVIATLHPNHTYEKVVLDSWQQTTYDVNDTCAARNRESGDPRTDADIGAYVAEYFKTQPAAWQTWYAKRIDGALGKDERNAALRAQAHADTPASAHFDALGRPFMTLSSNRVVCGGHDLNGAEESFATRVELDIEGNQRTVRDERKLPIDYLPSGALEQRIVMRYAYDMLGNRIHHLSTEAGARWTLNDAAGKPVRAWDSRGHNFTTAYDALRRPLEQAVRGTTPTSDPRTLNLEILVGKIEYGEPAANASQAERDRALRLNLHSRIYRHFDSGGVATNARLDANGAPVEAYDFKGNLLRSTRRLLSNYTAIPNWQQNPQLEAETFEASTRYDALNRPVQSVAPHSSLTRVPRPNKINVIQPVFNEANLLERVDVWLERAAEPATLLDPNNVAPSPVGVASIDYDAKGQRQRIDYKNGASTLYSYDPLTFRLIELVTQRNATAFPGDDPQLPVADWPGRQVQNLHYTYDPAGNITHIQDDAQQTIYFRNQRVEPSNDYTYDALYRLIQASGREHLGQAGAPVAHSHSDAGRVGLLSADATGRFAASDGNAMGTYIERYVYDAVGNFLQMQHRGIDPTHTGWTRAYDYLEASLIEDGSGGLPLNTSNRLSRTTLNPNGANPPQFELYQHDAHGNMVSMHHLGGGLARPNMHWDYKDQLRQTDLGGGGAAWYVYDASGQRVRKVWEKAPGLTEERIYLGGFEIFRKHGGVIGANTATLERETLHVMADKQRIALVETRTFDTASSDQAPRQLIRYQFGNHLGSASLELDEQAQIISYEEYAPYGSSTYKAVRSQTETAKRYRYTGKERDEESGFYYHGARYYTTWLGRWASADPIGIKGGVNGYLYVECRPIVAADPTGQIIWLFVIAVVAIATITAVSDAGAPTNKEDAAKVKPRIPDTEFAAHTAVTGISMAVGGGTGSSMKGAPVLLKGAAGGMVAGGVQAVGDQAIHDTKKGQVSSGHEYGKKAVEGAASGALAGAAFALAGKALSFLKSARSGGVDTSSADAAGARLQEVLKTGGPTGGNKAIAAAEIDVPRYPGESPLRARSGRGTPDSSLQNVPHASASADPNMPTFKVSNAPGEHSGSRAADAEINVLSNVKSNLPPNPQGTIDLATNKPLCPSCITALFDFTADYPGIQLRVFAPVRPVPSLQLGPLSPASPAPNSSVPSSAAGALFGSSSQGEQQQPNFGLRLQF
jgi:RHS repeat-associated protein